MKKLNKILIIITAVVITLSIIFSVKAQEGLSKDQAKYLLMSEIENVTSDFENLTDDLINRKLNVSNLSSNSYGIAFTKSASEKFKNTRTLDDLYLSELTEIESHYIIPENTTSGDLIIVVDARMVNEKDNEFLVLFEYHINSGNQVYGINTWVY